MTRRATIMIGCLTIVGAVAVAALTVFLFRGSDAPPQAGTDAGIAIDPSATDPAGVATSAMSGVFTWQRAVQDSPWQAPHDQRESLTGPMATAAAARPDPAPQPMSEWSAWSRSGDIVTAVAKFDGDLARHRHLLLRTAGRVHATHGTALTDELPVTAAGDTPLARTCTRRESTALPASTVRLPILMALQFRAR